MGVTPHLKKKTRFLDTNRDVIFFLTLLKTLHLHDSWQILVLHLSGEKVTILDTFYISLEMTKASSKWQQVALEYAYQAAASRLAYICTASSIHWQQAVQQAAAAFQQQHNKQPYSYLQQTPAPHNYYCTRMQFRSNSSSTLLSILLYIA